jgi:phosphonate transport system permease protein
MGAVSGPSSTASASLAATPAHAWTPRRVLVAGGAVALLAVCWRAAEVRIGVLFSAEAASALGKFLSGLFPPDFSWSFLRTVLKAVGQTLATAVASTLLSIALGLPLGLLASEMLWRRGILVEGEKKSIGSALLAGASRLARALLGFVRAVPDILWAILFVTLVGLGPLAGTLALAVAYSGMIGRVYSDVFDTVDAQPLEALQSTGASRLQIFLRGVWPQAVPALTAYTLYSFECCVRAASVLGLVGAGGIGYEIGLSMRLFEYGQVLTLILAFIGLLAITDVVSRRVRARLNRAFPGDVAERQAKAEVTAARASPGRARVRRVALWVALLAGVSASFYFSGFTGEALNEADLFRHAARFFGRMLPPDISWSFVSGLGVLLLQTIAIAVLGTLIGVVLGAMLSLPATASLIFLSPDAPGRHPRRERSLRWLVFWIARLVLNLSRAIPELVWVLVCILAIGIGPFAGTIAIGLHTAGVLGKLYAETMEEVPRRPLEALYALGASPLQVLLRGIWPQARPMLRNYTLLRWEANLRVSTILGLVGGGGLGQAIYNNIQLGFYPRVATMILLIYMLVIASDWTGDRLRGRVITQ